MQNSNPSHPTPNPAASSIEEDRARDHERARAGSRSGKRGVSELFAMFFGHGDEQPGEHAHPPDAHLPHNSGARIGHGDPHAHERAPQRVTLDELLPVFSEPIDWALARAELRVTDPVDVAALDRVRAAYESRLAWIHSDGARGEARPKLRPTDLITVAGLVIRSIDPGLAQRAAAGAREGLLEALADLIPLGLAVESGAAPPAPGVWYVHEIPGAPVPFGGVPFGGVPFGAPVSFSAPHPLGACFGGPVRCSARSACCCPHGRGF